MDGEIFTPKNGSVGKMIFGQKTDQFQTSHEMDIYIHPWTVQMCHKITEIWDMLK